MSNTATARQFKILGICDNVNACDCCGKTELQKTVAIENCETGSIGYFGTTCAMQPSKCFGFEKSAEASASKLNTPKVLSASLFLNPAMPTLPCAMPLLPSLDQLPQSDYGKDLRIHRHVFEIRENATHDR
jgi:hypothetical protein